MIKKFLSSLHSSPLTKAATIINWIGAIPIIVAAILDRFLGVEGAVFHWIPLLAFAFLGFGYALLLSMDSSHELFFDRPLFNGVPRWLWRWICTGFGFAMLAVIFFIYVSPLN